MYSITNQSRSNNYYFQVQVQKNLSKYIRWKRDKFMSVQQNTHVYIIQTLQPHIWMFGLSTITLVPIPRKFCLFWCYMCGCVLNICSLAYSRNLNIVALILICLVFIALWRWKCDLSKVKIKLCGKTYTHFIT